jgi:hypothetical protein
MGMSNFSANFSHQVKAEKVQAMDINSTTSLHKAGCAHTRKADWVGPERDGAELVKETTEIYLDDFYLVAPCARKA